MKNLTSKQINEIAMSVAGGCEDYPGEEILEDLGLDPFDLEEVCAEVEQYKCPGCSWWTHQGEPLLYENENGESVCEDCAEEN